MSRLLLSLVAIFVTIFFGAVNSRALETPWGEGYLPNAEVINQHGKKVRFFGDLIKGKNVVISFIFTSCRDICPVVTARLADVQNRLGESVGRDIFFLSISIDPLVDTPKKLNDYAAAFGVGKGWTFVTGKPEDISLIRYKLGERSRNLSDHSKTILIYNDKTGEWSKDSAFSDLGVLAANIQSMSVDHANNLDNGVKSSAPAAMPSGSTHEQIGSVELPGQSLFLKTCAACHTVGGGEKVGPDLVDIASRHPKEWIVSYLVNPQKLRAEGDPAALNLMARYPAVRMPTLSLSENDVADLMSYIAAKTYAATAERENGHANHSHHH